MPRPRSLIDQVARPEAHAGRRAIVAALAVLAFAGSWIAPASGQPSRPITLTARHELGGYVRPGAPAALSIEVSSSTLFAGSVRVSAGPSQGGGPVQIERAIEVAGGSKKIIRLVVPPSGSTIVALVDRRGKVLAQSEAVRIAHSSELVGVLAPTLTAPSRVSLPAAGRSAEVVPLGQDLLDLGPGGLGQLTHVLADAATAARLSSRRRSALLGWTSAGGELIVATAGEEQLAWLPAAWRGRPATYRAAVIGGGRVTIVRTPVSDPAWTADGPLWRRVVRPSAPGPQTDPLGQEWIETLASTGAFNRSRLGWLLAFVLLYAAICGPVNFLVLSRLGRREWAWITIPLLAVGFAGGAFLIGRGIGNGPDLQGTGVVVLDEGGMRGTFAVGTISRGGGRERVTLPGDWIVRPNESGGLFGRPVFDGSGQPVAVGATGATVRLGGNSAVVEFRLPVGGIGTLAASTVKPGTNPTAGELTWNGTVYTGSVGNPTRLGLTDARVFIRGGVAAVGDLPAGSRARPVSVAVADVREGFFNFSEQREKVSYSIVRQATAVGGLFEDGRAYLGGMADLGDVGAGLSKVSGRALVLIPLTIRSGGIQEATVRRSVIATNGSVSREEPFGPVIVGANTATIRFEFPAGMRPKRLRLDAPALPFGDRPDQPSLPAAKVLVYDPRTGRWAGGLSVDQRGRVEIPGLISAEGDLIVQMSFAPLSKVVGIPHISEAAS